MIIVLLEFTGPFKQVVQPLAEARRLVADHQASPIVAVVREYLPRRLFGAVYVIIHGSCMFGPVDKREVKPEGIGVVERQLAFRE